MFSYHWLLDSTSVIVTSVSIDIGASGSTVAPVLMLYVVEMSVTNSSFQSYPHPNNHTILSNGKIRVCQ